MKRKATFLSLLLFLLVPILVSFSQSSNNAINWLTNLDFAKLSAKEFNKPLFLFFIETRPSAVSNSVYNSTLANEIIMNKINNDFVAIRIQGDSVLQRTYNVNRFPTMIILDYQDNTELTRHSGIINSDNVFALLESALGSLTVESASSNSTSATTTSPAQDSQTVRIHQYETGAFISVSDEKWVHSNQLYPRIDFLQFNVDDKYYMLANRELNVYFAIPVKGKGTFWTLKKAENEDNNAWVVAGKITAVQNGTVSDFIKRNSLIGQENVE